MRYVDQENANNCYKGLSLVITSDSSKYILSFILNRMKKKLLTLFALLGFTVVIAQPEPPKPPSKAERLKHVTEKINQEITLTAAQKTKLEAAYSEFFDGME